MACMYAHHTPLIKTKHAEVHLKFAEQQSDKPGKWWENANSFSTQDVVWSCHYQLLYKVLNKFPCGIFHYYTLLNL